MSLVPEEKRTLWENHIQSSQVSGLTISAYCKQQGLRENQYYFWKKRLRETRAMDAPGITSAFVPVKLTDTTATGITLTLPNGIVISNIQEDVTVLIQQLYTLEV